MTMTVYTTSEITHKTGLPRHQLDYWDRTGLFIPSIRRGQGRGMPRLYSGDDLQALLMLRKLLDQHWSVKSLRKALDSLRALKASEKEAVLVDGKNTILALCRTKAGERVLLDALSSTGQQVLSIVLETLIEEVANLEPRSMQDAVQKEVQEVA